MTPHEIAARLAEPFPPSSLGWKPQAVSGNRALAVAYIDSRDVMERLDQVVGPDGWRDSYEIEPSGVVVCTLMVRFGADWVSKMDVGSTSDQPDAGDRMKSAFSDALKRAAVKFGIGRYLYSLPASWVDYDPHKKKFLSEPKLPAWALPRTNGGAAPTPEAAQRSAELLRELRAKLQTVQNKADLEKVGHAIAEARNAMTSKDLDILRSLYKSDLDRLGERQPGEDV